MNDSDCVRLLQWALPRLGLRWSGFRQVRGQVCKRIERRMQAVGVCEPASYMAYLGAHRDEWRVLDGLCTVSISRFYRDRVVFDCLGDTVLPSLAAHVATSDDRTVRAWSAGCASGEEPYSLSLIWAQRVSSRFPSANFSVVATDLDQALLDRARVACYPRSSVRELPPAWIDEAFVQQDHRYCLRDRWKSCVEFREQDLRTDQPSGLFHLVLCRNLAFTYFEEAVQRDIAERLAQRTAVDGFLVVGKHELLPSGTAFVSHVPGLGIYRRPS